MRKVLFLLLIVFAFGCESETEYAITNLTGINWYDVSIYLSNSEDGSTVKTVDFVKLNIGDVASFKTNCLYFHVGARDGRGEVVLSRTMPLSRPSISVTPINLY